MTLMEPTMVARPFAAILFGLSLLLIAASADSQDKTGAVTLQVVKYDGLKDAVLKNRGKVVLVDMWGIF